MRHDTDRFKLLAVDQGGFVLCRAADDCFAAVVGCGEGGRGAAVDGGARAREVIGERMTLLTIVVDGTALKERVTDATTNESQDADSARFGHL